MWTSAIPFRCIITNTVASASSTGDDCDSRHCPGCGKDIDHD
ncbi:hypothetical protein HMPREF9153_1758 [Cutibacterium avidum ATCC 25577]|uniref:Uncharacterized protein n=1 Tax=Cutibacterium avidum ATCC 25577 TaxID=997355 RepID=G4CZ86_9ACTN|nr:hypothetical protein HMPREF9153_1758 [Cutibacterium avidum ATCC 25577]